MRFEINAHKPFSICGYSFQSELGIQRDGGSFGPGSSNRGGERPVGWGIQRGQRSLGSGFQRRRRCLGGKNPMKPAVSWHTILLARSSVLYLWRPWVVERGCSGPDKHFPSATEQADFGAPRAEIQDLPRGKIRLFGCRWCREMERQSAAEPRNGAASPGKPKGYQAPSRRSDASSVTLEMQSSSVLEDHPDRS